MITRYFILVFTQLLFVVCVFMPPRSKIGGHIVLFVALQSTRYLHMTNWMLLPVIVNCNYCQSHVIVYVCR